MHPGSKDLMEAVAQWCPNCDFPFSRSMGWERWGILGVLSDFVLHYTQGDIAEVGVCESSIFLTKMAKKYSRRAYHCDIQRSVIENCLTVPDYFAPDSYYAVSDQYDKNIPIRPGSALIYCGSSDEFFKNVVFTDIALGFIDGEHTYEQVKKDYENMLEHIVTGGYIFFHDTYPPSEAYLETNACGTVYKLRQDLEKDERVDCFTFTRSAWDVGLTMCRKKINNLPHFQK